VGVIPEKPSRDFTRPLGMPSGLKGLLHTLNAIVSPTKADLCFLFLFVFSFFVLLRDIKILANVMAFFMDAKDSCNILVT
jgi:hypothetical protein